MIQQAGCKKIELFDVRNLNRTYTTEGKLISVSSPYESIVITDCQNPELQKEINIGSNNRNMYNYKLSFTIFDMTIETMDEVEALINVYGWIAKCWLRDGTIVLIDTPVFLQEVPEMNSSISHHYSLEMKNQLQTVNDLLYFE